MKRGPSSYGLGPLYEIALILGWPLTTVEHLHNSALKKIRKNPATREWIKALTFDDAGLMNCGSAECRREWVRKFNW